MLRRLLGGRTNPPFCSIAATIAASATTTSSHCSVAAHRVAGIGQQATGLVQAAPGQKIGGAVVRNRAKRRLREAARLLLPRLARPGWDYVFIARQDTADIGWARLLDDMESALISLAAD